MLFRTHFPSYVNRTESFWLCAPIHQHTELQKALDSLKFIDAKILGFVVNYESEKKKYGYYAKYGYSRYGDYTY